MTKMKPNNVKNPEVIARLPPENRRLRNTVTSSIGWGLRRSQSPNTTKTTAAEPNPSIDRVLVHPQVGASITV